MDAECIHLRIHPASTTEVGMTSVHEPVTRTEPTVDAVTDAIERDGWALVENVMPDADVEAARADLTRILETTPFGRGEFEGFRTRRVYGLFGKTRAMDAAATNPLVLGVLDRVLGHYQLSAPTGIEIGAGETAQPLHPDDAIYPLPRPHGEIVVNAMWPLCDFTTDNGGTVLLPGTHRWGNEFPTDDTPRITVEMSAGSLLLYSGNLWHGGGANHTDRPRLGVVLHYAASWLRPVENHVLVVPPEQARDLPVRLQELLGYNIREPFIGYVDGRHPRKLL
jgi:ectoine hydroxylase-related dioxygenase (phytanoyl-CoA dioxygenase family)